SFHESAKIQRRARNHLYCNGRQRARIQYDN
ncbi:collagen-binding protein, partial [Enterococcus faecium]